MKYIAMIRRRDDLDRPRFRAYYEQTHAPLALTLLPPDIYRRNHLIAGDEIGVDCLSEFAYADGFNPMAALSEAQSAVLAEDEARFMDRSAMRVAAVSPLAVHLKEGQVAGVRELWLLPYGTDLAPFTDCFSRLVRTLAPGQAAVLERLEPYYCERIDFAAMLTIEGRYQGDMGAELIALGAKHVVVECCSTGG